MKSVFMKGIAAGVLGFLAGISHGPAAELPGTIDLGSAPTADVLKINGGYPGEYAGLSVASGDVNGDGIDDVVYGSLTAGPKERTRSGMVTVVFGAKDRRGMSPIDTAEKPARVLQIWGDTANTGLGQSVAVGDLDHDGIGDIIMGANSASPGGRAGAGTVFVLFGSAGLESARVADLALTRGDVLRIDGRTGSQLGICCASGDVNGDGIADAILGAWCDSPRGRWRAGSASVLFGSTDLKAKGRIDLQTQSAGMLTISGARDEDNLGIGTALGDVNGDGYDDILAGAWMADIAGNQNNGAVYVVFGGKDIASAGEVDLAAATRGVVRISGAASDDYTGGVIAAKDVTGDGIAEIAIDAYGAETSGGYNAGKTWVVFGSPAMSSEGDIDLAVPGSRALSILGEAPEDHLGKPSVGDVNGDGIGDIITQANSADVKGLYDAGKAYVVFGSAGLRDLRKIDLARAASGVVKILGEDSGGNLGLKSAAGDIDADGYDEVILGAHSASPLNRASAGRVYVVWGGEYTAGYTQQGHFRFTPTASDSARVLIPKEAVPTVSGSPILPGDEIGIFTPSGLCAGAGVWTGEDLSITIFGDDPQSYSIVGFRFDDPLSFRVWIKNMDSEYAMVPRFASTGSTYQPGAVIELASLRYSHFFFEPGTADSAVVAIPKEASPVILGAPLAPGDEIGIFTPSGLCAGAGAWTGEDLSITVWGDDPQSYHVTGFRDGDPLAFRVWVRSRDREYPVNPRYTSSPSGYQPGAVIEVASLQYSHFRFEPGTADSATVLIPGEAAPTIYGTPVIPGDEIGIFTASGVCAGAGTWTGEDLSITIWGGNPQSYGATGFHNGDPLYFRIWSSRNNREYQAAPRFASSEAAYWSNARIELAALSVRDIIDSAREQGPGSFALAPNYPNPFNPSTTISFTVPRASRVNIAVYNTLGAKVATLADGPFSAGTHRLVWNAESVASGTYFCRMRAGDFTETRRMQFIK